MRSLEQICNENSFKGFSYLIDFFIHKEFKAHIQNTKRPLLDNILQNTIATSFKNVFLMKRKKQRSTLFLNIYR